MWGGMVKESLIQQELINQLINKTQATSWGYFHSVFMVN